jgi:TonB-linked SusC/RagA family outer membrane protein
MKKKPILLACILMCSTISVLAVHTETQGVFKHYTTTGAYRQIVQRVITGTIYDESGLSLPGATVKVQGTERGAVTNIDGKYTIQVNSDAEVLIFSYIGYISQQIPIGDKKTLDVKLLPNPKNALDEVSVVAFGVQKKESVIGSITTIKPGELRVPSSNLTTALAGRVAGVIAYQRSGEPGADNADFFVRGITTFGTNTKPLILIDGIELTSTDLARLQTDDIATFSIMKDATATALYGARGANGVILVTTKQGVAGKAKVSLRVENSASTATSNVELADPVTYMKLANEATATRSAITPVPYLEDKIENTAKGLNPLIYPANDWRKMLFKDYANTQRYNLNVSGGGTVARYYVAGAFSKDNGLLKVDNRNNFNNNIDFKSYSLRSNVNIDLTKSTELIVRLSGNFDDYNGPIDGGTSMYRKVMRSNPVLFPAYYPLDQDHQFVKHIMFGNAGLTNAYINPYADMVRGYRDESRSQMLAQFELKQGLKAITEGLSVRAMVNLTRTSNFSYARGYNPFYYQLGGYDLLSNQYSISQANTTGTEYLGFTEGPKTLNSTFYFESTVNYNRTFASKHEVGGLLVMIARESLGGANAQDIFQSLPSRNLGISGRSTYAYDRRYFAEFNFGYNGSERFAENNRFGFFPSAGLAWSVSNEKFFAPLKNVISNLRFRYTYGLVGNDQIGDVDDRFFYLSNTDLNNTGRRGVFGRDLNEIKNGVVVNRYANPNITWERATKQNIAMELSILGKANLVAEYFTEKRDNILMSRASIPNTMGLSSVSRSNVGKANGRGVDVSLDMQHAWSKDLWLSVRGNFTYATSKYVVYEEPQYAEPWKYRVGNSLQQTFGYIAERLFVDDQEAANSPRQEFGGVYGGGDIKYTDVNRDGKVNEADMVPIGNPTVPEVVYGFGFSLSYKKFDISAFAQGSANQSFWIDPAATAPFVPYYYTTVERDSRLQYTNQLLQAYADSYWSEENRNVYAILPRLSNTPNTNNNQTSTWYMRNAAFLRLKQVEFGYTFPKGLVERIKASNFRIYASATNLLMFSKFKIWDAEMAGNGLGYPLQKVFNFGLNLTF